MNPDLEQLINDCWSKFNSFSPDFKVKPSIPILWFGDMEAYLSSPTKIITVALNPSEMEFPEKKGDDFRISARFPDFSEPFNPDNYYKTLNNYFRNNPYWTWFMWPEHVLNSLKASYKPGWNNTAIHLDLYAPVATTPHWNGLSETERQQLVDGFGEYFEKLKSIVKPDIILASLKRDEIKKHFFTASGAGCEPANAIKSWRPQKGMDMRLYKLKDGETLITGRNMRGNAFGGLTLDKCQEGMSFLLK